MLKEAADEIERLQREGRIGPARLDGIEWTPDQLTLIRRGVLLREALARLSNWIADDDPLLQRIKAELGEN